ncbi:MAG: cytochrome c family protein [Geminicoccaceae bacterium]
MHCSVSTMAACLAVVLLIGSSDVLAQGAPEVEKVKGPDECAECHKKETENWKDTHHYKTFSALPRSDDAKKITEKLGLKRIKSESVCLSCHFTSKVRKGRSKPIAGITCESCHNAGADYMKRHSEFSGKKKETESEAEAQQRWADAEASGMIRPHMLYDLTKNCYSCHIVPQEELVNKGGHTAGSKFELVSWSQGEIRHNTWHNGGKENPAAGTERQRMMYAVGLAVELEEALRAVGKATASARYAVAMAKRAHAARKKLREAAKALPMPEFMEMLRAAHTASLRLNNGPTLEAAADRIAAAARQLVANYDGTQLAAIDALIPGPDQYKGKPSQ